MSGPQGGLQGLLARCTVAPSGAGPVAVGVADVGGTDPAKKEGREVLEAADSNGQNNEENRKETNTSCYEEIRKRVVDSIERINGTH